MKFAVVLLSLLLVGCGSNSETDDLFELIRVYQELVAAQELKIELLEATCKAGYKI